MSHPKEHLRDWLRDAHAMELQSVKMMEKLTSRLEHYPELRQRMKRHIEETERQAERLQACVERNGGKTSAMKDLSGKIVATIQGLSGTVVEDEVVKGHLASYVFEHYEIASYRVLLAAAAEAGDAETRQVCQQNLQEEEEMASWLGDHLDATVQEYLQRDLADQTAKR